MTQPALQDIDQLQAWDALYNGNVAVLRDGPMPIKQYATPSALPAAAAHDRCLAWRNDGPGATWVLYLCDGTSWIPLNPPSDTAAIWGTPSVDAFGRTIKRTKIDFGLMPASGNSSIAHGIPDLDALNTGHLKVSGMASDGTEIFAFPDSRATVTLTATNIIVDVSTDLSAFYAWIEVEYVETP